MSEADRLLQHVERLVRSNVYGAFLIVSVAGTEDFLQMSAGPGAVQLDLPLITPRQAALEPEIRAVAAGEGLSVYESEGTDGARFLDMDLEKDSARVAAVCRAFLRGVFGAGEGARLEFEGDGLG